MRVHSRPPTLLTIQPDQYRFKDVGRTQDKRQFFLTMPFLSPWEGEPGSEYLALYLFDLEGGLLEARISELGPPDNLDPEETRRLRRHWLAGLGRIRHTSITIEPFQVERFGLPFGLIPHPPESDNDLWTVTVEPGSYVEFVPPWDGRYNT